MTSSTAMNRWYWHGCLALTIAAGCSGCWQSGTRPLEDAAEADAGPSDGRSCGLGRVLCAGRCVDTNSDPGHCGGCGYDCRELPGVHDGVSCVAGACDVSSSCGSGLRDCDLDAATGCEADLSRSPHCGACSATCAEPTPVCAESSAGFACASACLPHLTRCDTICADTVTDVEHCGSCSMRCASPPHGSASCMASSCRGSCDPGYILAEDGRCTVQQPRPISPLSTTTVTTRRPTLEWESAAGTDGAEVEICADPGCAVVITTFAADGQAGAPAVDLPPGVVFWRLRGRAGTDVGERVSPTWQFTVGARSASVDTAWGAILDINGDGYSDVAVSASGALSETGQVYVFSGGPSGLSASSAVVLTGPAGAHGAFGRVAGSAGDVNGDGFGDLVVGAPDAYSDSGAAYLYMGSASGITTSGIELRAGPSEAFGSAVGTAGDTNHDGYAEVLVGAYMGEGGGRTYVYSGGAEGLLVGAAAILGAPDGGHGGFGSAFAGAADVNGDRYADVVVGASMLEPIGRAYVFLGGAAGLETEPSATWDAPDSPYGSFGTAIANIGDVNGDGCSDVLVGAPDDNSRRGRAHVYLGSLDGIATVPVTLPGTDSFGRFGLAVAGGGDMDGDGYSDIAIGAPEAMSRVGRVYVFPGGPAGVGASTSRTGPDGGHFGGALGFAGDLDGDGFADLVVGAPNAERASGRSYVFPGSSAGTETAPSITLSGSDGENTFFGTALAN